MSAREDGLLAQLVRSPTPAEKALRRIAALCREPNHRVTRQIRLLEIALEGLGVPTREREKEVQRLVQWRRDMAAKHRAAELVSDGGTDEVA